MEWYSTKRDQLLTDMSESSQVNPTALGRDGGPLNVHSRYHNKEQTFHPSIN